MANLITVDTYKELEGITSTKEDTKLDIFVPAVSQLVKTYCGNSIIDYYSTSKVETFSIDWGTHIVQLTESPLVSVSSVETRDSVVSAYTVLDPTKYYVDTSTDSIHRVEGTGYNNWPRGAGSVRVTYTAGYEECPLDLKLAVADLITYYLRDEHKARQTLSGATRENPETSLRNTPAFPDHIKRVLDLYKNF
jgi:hypothetical protein